MIFYNESLKLALRSFYFAYYDFPKSSFIILLNQIIKTGSLISKFGYTPFLIQQQPVYFINM